MCQKKSEEKALWFYKWFHSIGCNPAVKESLLTCPSSRQQNFSGRIGHIYQLLCFAHGKYRQATSVHLTFISYLKFSRRGQTTPQMGHLD